MSYAVTKIESRRQAVIEMYKAAPAKMAGILAKAKPEQAKARAREQDMANGRTQAPNLVPAPAR